MARPKVYQDFGRLDYQFAWREHSACLRELGVKKRDVGALHSGFRDVYTVEVMVGGKRRAIEVSAGSVWDAKAKAIRKICVGEED